ncbi:hypothetical protein [Methylicorpusculum sp.]|uniref:hypothetical protein n=1 Tax=Methylicorpusculum sp. TaxID=2713644 RepID=UPI0027184FD2|nr:hypothetical protein [Methylicorpusculum sp.]MDO9239339.1 hypothetical protein [Methylicorpusculum sp.]
MTAGGQLDAEVLGPRLALGTTLTVCAWGAIGVYDRGLYDDKPICSLSPVSPWQ